MTFVFQYLDGRTVEFDGIREMLRRCEALPGFEGLGSKEHHNAFFERADLQSFEIAGAGVSIGYTDIKGEMEGDTPFEDFRRILRAGAETVGATGAIELTVGFEERESRQTRRTADRIGVGIMQGRTHVSYSARGSRVLRDPEYRKTFMARLADDSPLPLSIHMENGNFRLAHASDGWLWTSADENPSGFRVAVPDGSALETVDVLEDLVAGIARRRFDHRWAAHPAFEGRALGAMEEGPRILDAVRGASLPATRYHIHVAFHLEDIAGIETLKRSCAPGDSVFLTVASFKRASGRRVRVKVVTGAEGHRIEMESASPLDAEEVCRALGLESS